MYPQTQTHKYYWIPFTLLLLVLLVVPTLAVTMRVTAGFDGVGKTFSWTPVAVEINNNTDKDITGLLLISQEKSKTLSPTCSVKVILPAHSKKLYHNYIRLGQAAGIVNVDLVQNGKLIESKKANINLLNESSMLFVSVGNRASCPSFLTGEKVPVPLDTYELDGYSSSTTSEADIYASSITPDKLPDRPAAYDGIDMLMVSSLPSASVSPKVLEALQMWVASGGVLVVSASANYKDFDNSFFNELLPVNITGAAAVKAFGSSEPIAAINSTAKPGIGRVIQSQAGVPLLVERNYGAGKVVFLAVDRTSPAFRNWNGQTKFWKDIKRSDVNWPLVAESLYDTNILEEDYYPDIEIDLAAVVAQNTDIKAPSFNLITLYLLAYFICLVPVNYVILRRKNRPEMAWVSTPIIILAFTICAYGIGYTMKGGKLKMNEVRVIEASADCRYGRMLTNASIFSPARSSYQVSIQDPIALSVMKTGEKEDAPRTFIDEQVNIEDVKIAMWSSRLIESKSGIDLGGSIKADLVLDGNRVKGNITNNTGIDLYQCGVIYGDNEISLGILRRGDTKKIDIEYRIPYRYMGHRRQFQSMEEHFKYFTRSTGTQLNIPVLIAYSNANDPSFAIDGKKDTANVAACYMFRLGYKAGNSPFILGAGTAIVDIMQAENFDAGPNFIPGRNCTGSFTGAGYAIVSYQLPVPANGRVDSLEVRNSNSSLKSSIRNNTTGKWDPITTNPITNPDDYLNNRNEVRIKVKSNAGSGTCDVNVTATGTQY